MADSSALCCFSSFPSFHSIHRSSKDQCPSKLPLPSPSPSPSSSSSWRITPLQALSLRSVRCCATGNPESSSGDLFGEEESFGFYPWDPRASSPLSEGGADIQWVPDDRVTLFTSDGLIQIGGSLVPRRVPPSDKQGRSKASQRLQRFQERNYMNPHQGLCLGALFDIAATNGLDTGRRLCIFGFCRSIEMLNDVVEDTVLEHGGEVVAAEKESKGGLQEKLSMIVAVPLLWGIPPASDTLHLAVRSGGGIIEKVYWQWDFL